MPLILLCGLIFGFGLAFSHMARPEVVIDFLTFEDLGLLFVMFGGSIVAGLVIVTLSSRGTAAPLTDRPYGRRLKSFDRNVLVGGAIFGIGWGLSGICPGAGYASLGIGNWPILYAIAGMFLGAYAQGVWRSRRSDAGAGVASDG
ncbi:YeeE/YedE family protein [Natronomonas sp. LN261]|jgi:uncharacterized membrane protein YedE/YeeE|uniref:YeeE/YedE family protein n=1 Tax=Natronomonas sp. LN261 TaxID=2750669 RepID=UPI0015EFB607|nr:DUF6691 family protein [Natronomonas sp. LN261]